MRVAMIPLDSRPPNWQFPARLAAIGGIELVLPPRALLGGLKRGTDGRRLAEWLRDTVQGTEGPPCGAAVFSWDALLYGGLVQSRQPELEPVPLEQLRAVLAGVDWTRTAGYCYITLPRLGITIRDSESYAAHLQVRDYFIEWGRQDRPDASPKRLYALAEGLGESAVRKLWAWRDRNAALAASALEAAAGLGLRHCHTAVEDNAPSGPHLRELAELETRSQQLRAAGAATNYSFFDGADEAACLLLAKAYLDHYALPRLPVQLAVHPLAPGPDRYTGLYESRSLGEGLTFLGDLLGLDYLYTEGDVQWLVAHGVQPQPDIFEAPPESIFANPYLLPPRLDRSSAPLYISDLGACNGANPYLPGHLVRLGAKRIAGLCGFNTNFNTLGVSAAWLRLGQRSPYGDAARRFLLERLADDIAYQSVARPTVMQYVAQRHLEPFDFAAANQYQLGECQGLCRRAWRQWCEGQGAPMLAACGYAPLPEVEYSFPWQRAFEVEVEAS